MTITLTTKEKKLKLFLRVYKIIILLNYLEKVSEKIIAIRLLYLVETTDLLNNY